MVIWHRRFRLFSRAGVWGPNFGGARCAAARASLAIAGSRLDERGPAFCFEIVTVRTHVDDGVRMGIRDARPHRSLDS